MDQLLYSYGQAANTLGISTRTLHRLVKSGKLQTVPIGRRSMVTRATLQALAAEGIAEIPE